MFCRANLAALVRSMLTAPEATRAMQDFLKLDALTDISEEQIETTVRPWLTAALGNDVDPPLTTP